MWRVGGILAVLSVLWLLPSRAGADLPDGFNHPEVAWQELSTEHFVVVFAAGLEDTARLAARLLETVHEPTCAALGTRPKAPTTVILADFDDVGFNNFARRMQHVIYLSNPVMNQARVDREQWLHHLLAHEYVHVVNGWALRDYGRFVGPLSEWTGMELQPQWFTEGLAEYISSGLDQTEGSFILQAAQQDQLLYGGKLDIADLRFDVIETSVVYKQGHSMCQYLADRYGNDVFRKIIEQYGHTPQFDIAFRIATGVTVEAFHQDWLGRLRERAAARPREDTVLRSTSELTTPLEAALGARMSPNGEWLAVYGVPNWEEPIPGLFLRSADGRRFRRVASNLDLYDSWKLSWSRDSRYLVYSGRTKSATGAILNRIFVYDAAKHRTWAVNTGDLRVFEPEISPDGGRIAFTTYHQERALLATCKVDGSDVQYPARAVAENCFSPTWSPDGRQLAFSLATADGADLATINLDGSGFQRLTNDPWPDQYPAWSPDGRTLAFVSFRQSGERRTEAAVSAEAQGLAVAATNLYTMPAAGGPLTQVTQATSGGTYYPTWSPDGRALVFSLFQVRTATIRRLELGASALVPAAEPSVEVAAEPASLTPAAPRVAALPAGSATLVVPSQTTQPEVAPARATGSGQAIPERDATPLPSGRSAGEQASAATVRPYRSFERVVPYVTRPYQGTDGLGDTFGVRVRFADPLLQHQLTAQVEYGTGRSDQISTEIAYLNAQTAFTVGANVFRRVPPLRGERSALVAETSTGYELLAELPLSLFGNAYSQDRLRFGYEYAWHHPFSTVGGVLRPAPRGAIVAGPSVGYQRAQLLPGIGEQEIQAKLTRSDDLFGAELDFFRADLLWIGRFFAPSPRAKLTGAAALNYFDGEDFTRAQSQQWLLSGEVRYDWRLCDQVLSRYTWPYVHVGPVEASASYQLRELINGSAVGADLRDRLTLELRNRGYLSRHATYELSAGPTFYVGANGQTDWLVTLRFDFRDLPF